MKLELKYININLKKFLLFLSAFILILHTLVPHLHSKTTYFNDNQIYSKTTLEQHNVILNFITQDLGENHLEVFSISNFDAVFLTVERFVLSFIKKHLFIKKNNTIFNREEIAYFKEFFLLNFPHRGPPFIFSNFFEDYYN